MVHDASSNSRQKRQAAVGSFQKWDKTKPINYKFDPNLNTTYAEIFRVGAKFWNDNTCLNIVESGVTPGVTPYIRVFSGTGCYSKLGYIGPATASQDLSLGTNCNHFGVTTHELAHALGFWHEQSRFDRDSFVTVDYSNMETFYLNAWQKESTTTNDNYNLPYDWGSGMHYGASKATGEPIFAIASDPIYQSTMGSYSGPSFKDLYGMNIHYGCMCTSGATCQNGGFPHPRNCNTCICPSGWGGTTCDQLQSPENGAADIGAILSAQNYFQNLTAKTGVAGAILDRAQTVHWHITVCF
uniref:Metalloendopeptidase n=1 Tax=Panagrolaimus sp. ES5 TaxID=591445 RepID=A0AC34FD61_9BILA